MSFSSYVHNVLSRAFRCHVCVTGELDLSTAANSATVQLTRRGRNTLSAWETVVNAKDEEENAF